MSGPLGVGLIGCGAMGRSLARGLMEVDQARLVGVADTDPGAAGRLAQELGAPDFSTSAGLLEAPACGAVIIATPGAEHRPLVEAAARAGRHVFVEKPLATSVADCDAILAAAGAAGVTLMVGQVLRYYPCWWKLLQLVGEGAVGRPLGIRVTRIGGGFGATWERSWRNSRALSGGTLMEVNAHEIDFMCQVGGDVARVYAEAEHCLDDLADYPDLYYVTLRFKSGALGMLHSSSIAAAGDLSGTIEGESGTLFYTNGMSGEGAIRLARRDGETTVFPLREIEVEPPVRRELRLFVESVRAGTPPPVSGEEARRNIAVAEAAYRAAETGRAVWLTPGEEPA